MHHRPHLPLLFAAIPALAFGTQWHVGPGLTWTAPSQVSTMVNDGDTINIAAGTYVADVARWTANDLLLRGVGGLAHLEANGNSYGDKAIWVIQGDNATVEWITFSECSVPDENGAGIRLEGHHLTVRHCYFHHNENGILCGELHPSTLRVEHCEFAHNGFGDGQSHNLYVGAIDSLIFRFNYSHHTVVGHELKSRAQVNVIAYNRIGNEADGNASREIDLPNGGQAYVIGNSIHQGPQGQNGNLVGFGMEGLNSPGPHELYLVHNTLVNERHAGTFFQAPAGIHLLAYNNILAGNGDATASWPTSLDTLGNLRRTNIATLGFQSAATYDYRITPGSPARNHGSTVPNATSGFVLAPTLEYVHPLAYTERCTEAAPDAGAYEVCTVGIGTVDNTVGRLYPNPVNDVLYVDGPSTGPVAAEVLDVAGRVRWYGTFQPGEGLPVHQLATGSYVLRIAGQAVLPFVKR